MIVYEYWRFHPGGGSPPPTKLPLIITFTQFSCPFIYYTNITVTININMLYHGIYSLLQNTRSAIFDGSITIGLLLKGLFSTWGPQRCPGLLEGGPVARRPLRLPTETAEPWNKLTVLRAAVYFIYLLYFMARVR